MIKTTKTSKNIFHTQCIFLQIYHPSAFLKYFISFIYLGSGLGKIKRVTDVGLSFGSVVISFPNRKPLRGFDLVLWREQDQYPLQMELFTRAISSDDTPVGLLVYAHYGKGDSNSPTVFSRFSWLSLCRFRNFQQAPYCKNREKSLLGLSRLCSIPGNPSPSHIQRSLEKWEFQRVSSLDIRKFIFTPWHQNQIFFVKLQA